MHVNRCEGKSWVWQRQRQHIDDKKRESAYWCLLSVLIIVTRLQQLVLSFNAQSWKVLIRCVKEKLAHWTGGTVDRRCEGNTVILRHVSEKYRFKSDGQEDASNNQLETLWPYKEVRHNVIKSQSKIKFRNHNIETPPRPTPKKLCINIILWM